MEEDGRKEGVVEGYGIYEEQFLKNILPAIESFNLSEAQITKLKDVNCNNSRRNRQKQNMTNSISQESNDMLNRRIGGSIPNSDIQVQSSLCTEHPDGQVDQCVLRNLNYYTTAEDTSLLKFIAQHKRYMEAGGVRLWKLMERKKLVPGRSWQPKKKSCAKVKDFQTWHSDGFVVKAKYIHHANLFSPSPPSPTEPWTL
jgi:hypothetical protein